MTRDDIVRLREECDQWAEWHLQCVGEYHPDFHTVSDERFAKLVYEKAWADAALAATHTITDAAILKEREACAKVCGELADNPKNSEQYRMGANWARERIRARSNP